MTQNHETDETDIINDLVRRYGGKIPSEIQQQIIHGTFFIDRESEQAPPYQLCDTLDEAVKSAYSVLAESECSCVVDESVVESQCICKYGRRFYFDPVKYMELNPPSLTKIEDDDPTERIIAITDPTATGSFPIVRSNM